MAAWPASLPDFALQQGYVEGFRNIVQRSEMSSGATKRRKRFTDAPRIMDIVVPLTSAEVDIFIDFYENDIADGALSFTKTHPRLNTTQTFVFRADLDPLITEGGDNYLLTLKLEILP